jgi:cell division protease FtsH
MSRINRQLRQRIAYHEAGHAVISHILSVPHKFVTIRHDTKTAGMSVNVGGQPVTDTSDVNNAIVSFAGPIAEVDFCGRDTGSHFSWHNDYKDIRRRLMVTLEDRIEREATRKMLDAKRKGTGKPRTQDSADYSGVENAYRSLRAKTKREAIDLVREHKAAIRRVAQALLKHEKLTGKQVRELVQSTKG